MTRVIGDHQAARECSDELRAERGGWGGGGGGRVKEAGSASADSVQRRLPGKYKSAAAHKRSGNSAKELALATGTGGRDRDGSLSLNTCCGRRALRAAARRTKSGRTLRACDCAAGRPTIATLRAASRVRRSCPAGSIRCHGGSAQIRWPRYKCKWPIRPVELMLLEVVIRWR